MNKSATAAKYDGQEVKLNKPYRSPAGSSKKFHVYVMDGGKVKKVSFGDPNMEIRRDNKAARDNFRSRHGCDTKKDKTTPGYWSCKMWESGTSVTEMLADAGVAVIDGKVSSSDVGLALIVLCTLGE